MSIDYRNGEDRRTVYITMFDPSHETKMDRLKTEDDRTVRDIERLQKHIEDLRQHRKNLFDRAQYLAQETGVLSIELKRERHYYHNNKVFYYLTFARTFPDGTERIESNQKFPGTERHKAISAYNEAVKNHPGAPHSMDIAKGKWER